MDYGPFKNKHFFSRRLSIIRQEELRCPLPLDGFFRAAPAPRFPFARPWMLGGGLCLVSSFWLSGRGKPTAQPRRPFQAASEAKRKCCGLAVVSHQAGLKNIPANEGVNGLMITS